MLDYQPFRANTRGCNEFVPNVRADKGSDIHAESYKDWQTKSGLVSKESKLKDDKALVNNRVETRRVAVLFTEPIG